MSKTKEVILKHSLRLFNEEGLSNIPLRNIALDMGISIGNLQYHFKKRGEIIENLYFQLVAQLDAKFSVDSQSDNPLKSFFDVSEVIAELFYEYRFFLLDFVQIMRKYDKIRKHYLQLTIRREQQFLEVFNSLISIGLIRAECLPNEYKNLFKRLQIVSDFWISSAIIMNKNLSKKEIKEYVEVMNQNFFPYLTGKGVKAYKAISNC